MQILKRLIQEIVKIITIVGILYGILWLIKNEETAYIGLTVLSVLIALIILIDILLRRGRLIREGKIQPNQTKNKNSMRKKINFWNFIVLALVGGFFGLQEFYRGNAGLGILAVLFCWTCIPALVAFIEALVWLFKGQEIFDMTYNRGIAE